MMAANPKQSMNSSNCVKICAMNDGTFRVSDAEPFDEDEQAEMKDYQPAETIPQALKLAYNALKSNVSSDNEQAQFESGLSPHAGGSVA